MNNPTIPNEDWPPHTELEPEEHPNRILWLGETRFCTSEHGAARRSFIERHRRALWMIWFTTREYELEQRVAKLEAELEAQHKCRSCNNILQLPEGWEALPYCEDCGDQDEPGGTCDRCQIFVDECECEPEAGSPDKLPRHRIHDAVSVAIQYGNIDEAHHRAWVIDQMLRHLLGDNYDRTIAESCAGEDGPNTRTHDVGIPP